MAPILPPTLSAILPPELEDKIFKIAAELNPDTIPRLCLVAHRVNEWFERIKYQTITPSGRESTCSVRIFKRVIQSDSKPVSFFHDYVRHLFVDGVEDNLSETLSACGGVQTLAVGHYPAPSILPVLPTMRPRRLSSHVVPLLDLDQKISLSSLISTSSIIFTVSRTVRLAVCCGSLPTSVLTHTATFCGMRLADGVLTSCTRLRTLINMDNALHAPRVRSIDDGRFVYMGRHSDLEGDWITGTKGGMDMWARADKFIAMKQRGEIQPTWRCWIEAGDEI